MKILLIGAAGQVGTDLRRTLPELGSVLATARDASPASGIQRALDVTDSDAIDRLVSEYRPELVVNASAYTAVDRAESEPDLAFRVNRDAPAAMARACGRIGATLVHYSTDYVFDGAASTPYVETAPQSPQGVYGASKAAGEDAVRTAGCDALILRTAWVYALHGQNFLRTMLRLASERDELRVVADQAGCPTPSWLIAETTVRMLRSAATSTGTYHLVTSGQTTWHGFAQAIFDAAAARGMLARIPAMRPIATSDYPTPARRPAYSVLDNRALEAAIGATMLNWREALRETFDRGAATR